MTRLGISRKGNKEIRAQSYSSIWDIEKAFGKCSRFVPILHTPLIGVRTQRISVPWMKQASDLELGNIRGARVSNFRNTFPSPDIGTFRNIRRVLKARKGQWKRLSNGQVDDEGTVPKSREREGERMGMHAHKAGFGPL